MRWEVGTLAAQLLGWRPSAVRTLSERDDKGIYELDGSAGPLIAKLSADPAALAREVEFQEMARDAGVPVAPVVAVRVEEPALMVMGKVAGSPLSSPATAATEAGRHLRTFHELRPDPAAAGDGLGWGTRVARTAERHLAYLLEVGLVPAPDGERLLRRFEELIPDLDARPVSLLHGDLYPDHVLTDPDGTHVRAFLDFGDVRLGDAALDVALLSLDDEDVLDPLLDGYTTSPAERADLAELLPAYRLLCHLGAVHASHRLGLPASASHAAVGAALS